MGSKIEEILLKELVGERETFERNVDLTSSNSLVSSYNTPCRNPEILKIKKNDLWFDFNWKLFQLFWPPSFSTG